MPLSRNFLVFLLLFSMAPAWGQAQPPVKTIDPWEPMNRKLYVFNDTLDRYLLKPVAKGYHFVMPDFAERGVSNFIVKGIVSVHFKLLISPLHVIKRPGFTTRKLPHY